MFSLSFYKDIPWVLAAGGSKGELAVWDTEENEAIAKHFTPFLDKSKIPEEDLDDAADDDNMGDESEDEKDEKKQKKIKKNKKLSKLNKISEGIQKIRDLKKKK